MKMFQLKCPYCGADLEVKDEIDTFYCMYCGGKIMMEFDDNTVKLHMQAKELEYKKYKLDRELEDKEKERKRNSANKIIDLIANPSFWLFVVLILCIIFIRFS